MNLSGDLSAGLLAVQKIADAVLYEGYILYPYRPSSIKNQQRWNFGTLFPRTFAEAQHPQEAWFFRAEVLIEGSHNSRVHGVLRFLQLLQAEEQAGSGWSEGFARARTLAGLTLRELSGGVEQMLDLSRVSQEERAFAPLSFTGRAGVVQVLLHAEPLSESLYRLSVSVRNETHMEAPAETTRVVAQRDALTSAHLLLQVENGKFVSLLEPPPELAAAAADCSNQGVFPVLTGEVGDRQCMLCSPIILYDYPQIAPESAGDFFDGTEMDEMLALRVLTLTEEEKAEMRRADPHARAILERTETLPHEQLLKVHGAVRGMRPVVHGSSSANSESLDHGADAEESYGSVEPWNPFEERPALESVTVFGVELRMGDRVRLWPQKKADIMDMVMQGKIAIIEAIEQDLEDNVQFAVVLEDDPGRDMGLLRQAGHRFFFSPEEVEPLAAGAL